MLSLLPLPWGRGKTTLSNHLSVHLSDQECLNPFVHCYRVCKILVCYPVAVKKLMRILGIDPGIATVGFGVIQIQNQKPALLEVGVIKTSKSAAVGDRLHVIHQDMAEILATWQPDQIGLEKLFFYRMGNLINVAQARGVILLCLAEYGRMPIEFSPPQIKQTLTGYGNADKAAVHEAVMRELSLSQPIKPDDASDALAIALSCWMFHT